MSIEPHLPAPEMMPLPLMLEPWLRLCAGNRELLANYDPSFALRATDGGADPEEWLAFFG